MYEFDALLSFPVASVYLLTATDTAGVPSLVEVQVAV